RRRELGCGAQILFSLRLPRGCQGQAKIHVGLKYGGFCLDGLLVGLNRLLHPPLGVIEEAQVIPCGIVIRPLGDNFLKQGFRRSIVLLADGIFSTVELGGDRVLLFDPAVPHGPLARLLSRKRRDRAEANEQRESSDSGYSSQIYGRDFTLPHSHAKPHFPRAPAPETLPYGRLESGRSSPEAPPQRSAPRVLLLPGPDR